MRNRHVQVQRDNELLRTITRAVKEELLIDERQTRQSLFVKFVFYILISGGFYITLLVIQNPVLFIVNYIVLGFATLLLAFNFAHDLSHDTIFKSRRWNNLGFTLIYTMVGAHAEEWKKRHIQSHHFAPNVKDYDCDLRISGLIRVVPGSKYHWYHRFQHIYAPFAYMTYSLFWVFIKDFVIYLEMARYKGLRYHLVFWTQKFTYLGLMFFIPLLLSNQQWVTVLAGFLAMHLLQSLFLLFTFFMTHHVEGTFYPITDKNGMIQSSWVMNQINSSNDMHPFSRLANFILGGFNNHIAHHLFPNINHIHYPELNKILYCVLRQQDIEPNQTSYFGGIRSHLRLLKMMGSKITHKKCVGSSERCSKCYRTSATTKVLPPT